MISVFTPSHDASFLPEIWANLKDQGEFEWLVLLNGGAQYENTDPRVVIHRERTGITNVGYLKRMACELCSGDVLVELDHDDLLLYDALNECESAFSDPSVDFAYSNAVCHDVRTDTPVSWPARYGWSTRPVTINGKNGYVESVSAEPEPQSISRIHFAPNHFRAWRAEFYHRIGGHNATMKISDDHDLMCRSYIEGKMLHIDKPLYFYRVHGDNTWLKNVDDIQKTMWHCHQIYFEPMMLKWARTNGLRCVDLCGGIDKPEGYESVDLQGADITADLNECWPFEDNSVGVIRAHDAIEHLRDPVHTMMEAYRVLADGGAFLIQVPSTDGVGAWCAPDHVSFWNRRSFRYFCEPQVRRYIEYLGCTCKFQAIRVDCVTRYDDVAYVDAELIAIKSHPPKFYGECHWR